MKNVRHTSRAVSAAALVVFLSFATRGSADGPKPAVTSAPSSGDATTDQILDRLETRGRAINGLSTQLEYFDKRFEPVEDKVIKHGELLFRRLEPNSHFLITFHETISGGVKDTNREAYLFDGGWFTERNERAKTIIRRQMVRPGVHIDPFRIGSGPFPLPFGQTRADMLKNFTITRPAAQPDDPPACDHLRCVPRESSDLSHQYKRVDMYVDRKLEMPVRIEVERVSDDNVIDVRFSKLNPNEAPAASRFSIDKPGGPDWDVREEPLPIVPPEPPNLTTRPGR